MLVRVLSIFIVLAYICLPTWASEKVSKQEAIAFLDAPYKDLRPPTIDWNPEEKDEQPIRSDYRSMMQFLTPVRGQGARGTCSIFSAIALLEAHLVKKGVATTSLDLSEEWLEYAVMAYHRPNDDGSSSSLNFSSLYYNGFVSEERLPYIGQTWKKLTSHSIAEERCGDLQNKDLAVCLLGHWNPHYLLMDLDELEELSPQFSLVREEALKNKKKILRGWLKRPTQYWSSSRGRYVSNYRVERVSEIRRLLANDIPLTMGIDVYYGAWNHSRANSLDIGRDLKNWYQGIVGHPEPGSVDIIKSKERDAAAGHSIMIFGYDDNREITTQVKMQDGSIKKFQYKGVYYFKNSWGVEGFGKNFTIDGERFAGHGMIPYKHAHQYGAFYRLPIKK